MELAKKVQQFIYTKHLFTKNDQLLVAVSGGVDSVVLCHILHQLGYTYTMAHCNFQLRGAESDNDETSVVALAKQLDKQIATVKMDTTAYMQQHKVNVQLAARQLRYTWFNELINEATGKPYTHILIAHHSNDSVETLLINLCKGTGIDGLTGIPVKNGTVVRPLLCLTRQEIADYADANQLPYVTDSSNAKNEYTRNFIRNEVLPLLATKFGTVPENISTTIAHLLPVANLYKEAVASKIAKIVEQKGNELHIPIRKLIKEKEHNTLLYEIVKHYGFVSTQLPEIIKLLTATVTNSSYIANEQHQIIKNREWLIITAVANAAAELIVITENTPQVGFANGTITITKNTTVAITNAPNTALLDARSVAFPLLLRKWKEGDYFYPLGMRKKKKVARFLIDAKLSKTEKQNVWVLESNQRIVWVVGYRIDDRCKVAEASNSIVQIQFTANST